MWPFDIAKKKREREEKARLGEVKIGPGPQYARGGIGTSGPRGLGGTGGIARNTGPAPQDSNDLLNPLNIASPLNPIHQSIYSSPSPTPTPEPSYYCTPSPSPSHSQSHSSSHDHGSSSSSSSNDYGSNSCDTGSSSSGGGSDW